MIEKRKLKFWSILSMLFMLLTITSCKNDEDIPVTPDLPVQEPISLFIDPKFDSQLQITTDEDGTYTLTGRSGNTDPYFLLEKLEEDIPEECCVLEFEYTLAEDIDNFEIFFIDKKGSPDPACSSSFGTIKSSSDWATYSLRLKKARNKFNWGFCGEKLRIDIGGTDRTQMKIKNMKFRVMNAEEIKAEEEEDNAENEKQKYEQSIKDYLAKEYECKITHIDVTSDQITIKGNYIGTGNFFLAEIPTFVDLFSLKKGTIKYFV